jgi:hypothetical protein
MASAYFTFPALLVIYVAQRAVGLRSALGQPRFAVLPQSERLRAATAHA